MELNGREIGFRRSVFATMEIAKICPNKDPNRLGELLGGDIVTSMETAITFVTAMSKAFEAHKKLEDPAYKPNPITEEELLDETEESLMDLVNAAVDAYMADGKQTVEAESVKGKNAEAASE